MRSDTHPHNACFRMYIIQIMDDVLSFDLLVDFDALFRERHLTRAAARTGRSQPAMSRSLLRLRQTFDDVLFVRSHEGMLPTPRANELAPRIEALLIRARELTQRPTFEPKTLVRTFVMGASDLVDAQLLASVAARVSAEAPKVDLVSVPAGDAATEALAEGRLDLWIGPEASTPVGTKRQHLFDDGFLCAVRQGHPLFANRARSKKGGPAPGISLEVFASLSHIQIAPRGMPGGYVDTALAQAGFTRRVAVRTSSFLSAPWLASLSDMVLTAPSRLLLALEGPYGLLTFPPPLSVPGFRIFQAWHPRVHSDPAHRWFRSLLRDEAGHRHG